ncbi:MAG: NrdH-redoxin [Micrococcales bacterium]|nr:NrdH-redoxin [Micrococcales bacterium]
MSDSPSVVMYGADWCRDCRRSKALLDRLQVPYAYIDVENTEGAADAAQAVSGRMNIPVVVFPDGSHQVEPSDAALQGRLAELDLL